MFHKRNLWAFVGFLALILFAAAYAVFHKAAPVTYAPESSTAASVSPSPSPSPTASTAYYQVASGSFTGQVPPVPQLVAIRTGAHAGYDRIAFDFKQAAAPGYQARYVDKVVLDPSGQPVSLPGAAFIQLSFTPAQAHDDSGKALLSPSPTNPVPTGMPVLKSYVMNGDFEGHVSIALGTAGKNGFHVSSVHNVAAGIWTVYVDIAQ